ncbi:hypothetical protein C5167_011423 [Papaver somniferum]|uniref:Uncharacterized protein n=1 Tax=Papaver somniferum TaxID=3469 RepID=A0A4Y7K6X1_PAPSO|nr:hypothetical protein C5167_011423 [Papaver somniferum]
MGSEDSPFHSSLNKGMPQCTKKTADLAMQIYTNPATSQPNVSGLILPSSADIETELSQSGMFDPCLQANILNVVDVSMVLKMGSIKQLSPLQKILPV